MDGASALSGAGCPRDGDHRRAAPSRAVGGRRPDGGFTLIEVIVALGLMTVLVATLSTAHLAGIRTAGDLQRRQTAIALAEQAIDAATAVSLVPDADGCVPMLRGRTRSLVTAAWSRVPAGVDLGGTDPAWSAAACPGAAAVPLAGLGTPVADDDVTPATVRMGTPYVVRTFVGTCRRTTAGSCVRAVAAPASAPLMYRVVVSVRWPAGCPGGRCQMALTQLVDPTADPLFDSRAIAPPVAVDDAVCAEQETPLMLNLVANDSGQLGAAPVGVLQWPTRGTLGSTVESGYVSYTPALGVVNFTDVMRYSLTSADGRTSTSATVRITVRPVGQCP